MDGKSPASSVSIDTAFFTISPRVSAMVSVTTSLISNEEARELQIETGKDREDAILITVRDSGAMLKSGSLDRFFEPFYSTKPNGMGIGLSICRSIIEAHRGRIWATGNASHSITFHIILPAAREAAS